MVNVLKQDLLERAFSEMWPILARAPNRFGASDDQLRDYLDVNVNIAERLGAARTRVARIGWSRSGEENGGHTGDASANHQCYR